MIDRNEIRNLIWSGICEVTFRKSDGEIRDMMCTRDIMYIPDEKLGSSNRKLPEDSLPVWDLNKEEWRSFRYDRLLRIECLTGINKETILTQEEETQNANTTQPTEG